MISFLLAAAPYIPILLNAAGFLMKWFGATDEQNKEYAALLLKNKDAGLITVETHDALMKLHEENRAKWAAKNAVKNPEPPKDGAGQ